MRARSARRQRSACSEVRRAALRFHDTPNPIRVPMVKMLVYAICVMCPRRIYGPVPAIYYTLSSSLILLHIPLRRSPPPSSYVSPFGLCLLVVLAVRGSVSSPVRCCLLTVAVLFSPTGLTSCAARWVSARTWCGRAMRARVLLLRGLDVTVRGTFRHIWHPRCRRPRELELGTVTK